MGLETLVLMAYAETAKQFEKVGVTNYREKTYQWQGKTLKYYTACIREYPSFEFDTPDERWKQYHNDHRALMTKIKRARLNHEDGVELAEEWYNPYVPCYD